MSDDNILLFTPAIEAHRAPVEVTNEDVAFYVVAEQMIEKTLQQSELPEIAYNSSPYGRSLVGQLLTDEELQLTVDVNLDVIDLFLYCPVFSKASKQWITNNLFLLAQLEIFGYSTAVYAYNVLLDAKVSRKLLDAYIEKFFTSIPAPNHFNSQEEVDKYVKDVCDSYE